MGKEKRAPSLFAAVFFLPFSHFPSGGGGSGGELSLSVRSGATVQYALRNVVGAGGGRSQVDCFSSYNGSLTFVC